MNNLEKEFVPYQEARDLEYIGFREEVFATIDQTEYVHINGTKCPPRGAMLYNTTNCPTFSQAFRWLYQNLDIEKGVMPLDYESQQLLLKELIDKVSSKHLLV